MASAADEFCQIDIAADFVRMASEGLSVIELLSAWPPMGCELRLSYVSTVLKTVLKTPMYYHHYPHGDALELHSAAFLRRVDELLQHEVALAERYKPMAQAPKRLPPEAVKEMKLLQCCVQDALMLACTRFIDQTTLQ